MATSEVLTAHKQNSSTEVVSAFTRIPYGLIRSEIDGSAKDLLDELGKICEYYKVYNDGAKFNAEGTNGDYVPSAMPYRLAASLIDKEARFLFAEAPDISVEMRGDTGKPSEESAEQLMAQSTMVASVLEANSFENQLVKAARDCFIGKRVACMVNFSEDDGIQVQFLPSTQFIYEYKLGTTKLKKFVAFMVIKDSLTLSAKRIFKKKYELADFNGYETVYVEEKLYDGTGYELEEVTEWQPTKLDKIPAVVILNDGLTGDYDGESEIKLLEGYEGSYSKLANADADAERKSMNSIIYTVDMDNASTKNLSSAPGAFWDLGSDQTLEKPSPQVGSIEPSMSYSGALKTTLDRIKSTGYEQVDVPNVNIETMSGSITSGKALKAIYWPLIVRCKEKMKTWAPAIKYIVSSIIDGAIEYQNCAKLYASVALFPIAYEVHVKQNTPLPEDETEEKSIDLSEVQANVMSKKSYMKKWHGLTDDEVDEELKQIAIEREIVEEASFHGNASGLPYGNEDDPAELGE